MKDLNLDINQSDINALLNDVNKGNVPTDQAQKEAEEKKKKEEEEKRQ